MKEYRSSTGERRLWFEDDEIEWMMEDHVRRRQRELAKAERVRLVRRIFTVGLWWK